MQLFPLPVNNYDWKSPKSDTLHCHTGTLYSLSTVMHVLLPYHVTSQAVWLHDCTISKPCVRECVWEIKHDVAE